MCGTRKPEENHRLVTSHRKLKIDPHKYELHFGDLTVIIVSLILAILGMHSVQSCMTNVFCVVFCRLLFVLLAFFLLAIAFSVLRFTASNYPFNIFKLLLSYLIIELKWICRFCNMFFFLTIFDRTRRSKQLSEPQNAENRCPLDVVVSLNYEKNDYW